MSYWVRLYDVVVNRIGIINQILGMRYLHGADNPCRLVLRRGVYSCEVCGCVFARFRMYDIDETQDAIDSLSVFESGLWLLSRSGRLRFTDCQPTAML